MSDQAWDLLKLALTVLFGGGAAWITTLVRERTKARADKKRDDEEKPGREDRAAIAITEQLQQLARGAVDEVRTEIETVRLELGAERAKTTSQAGQITRLTARVLLLEKTLHSHNIDVPPED